MCCFLNILSSYRVGLFVRIFCFYIVIILIALQSVNAISANSGSHDDDHQGSHSSSHQQSHQNSHQNADLSHNLSSHSSVHPNSHHSAAELLAFQAQALAGELEHSDADHPDCHHSHCHHSHHSSLVYLDLSAKVHLSKTVDKQVINKNALFNSLLISPASRPPIV